MIEIRRTAVIERWFDGLRDERARAHFLRRIDRAEHGNFGDVKPVGGAVSEMRIAYGPGYRLYFTQRGGQIVILLCGGDKGSQDRDIGQAKAMVKELG